MMKKTTLILVLSGFYHFAFSQKDSCYAGVYFTCEELLQNKVSHKINTDRKDFQFKFPMPADLKLTVKIATPDTAFEFKPGTIFGYLECGKKHRYYKGGDLFAQEDFYRIEEMGGLIIYSSVFESGSENFYSRDLYSDIHRLYLKNIEKDFPEQPEFVDAVKRLNKEGLRGDITKRDKDGKFIINQLYKDYVKTVQAKLK